MHWKSWQMRLTDESETQIRESYSISWLFLISRAQHKGFEFSIQLIVIISNLIITITMLLKCIQILHERPSFGIAYYKNHEAVKGQYSHTRLFKTLGLISETIYELLIETLWQIHELPKFNIFWKAWCKTVMSLMLMDSRYHNLVRI